jgi:hypothetical protein
MSWKLPAGMGDPPVGRKNMIGRAVRRGRGIKGRAADEAMLGSRFGRCGRDRSATKNFRSE